MVLLKMAISYAILKYHFLTKGKNELNLNET